MRRSTLGGTDGRIQFVPRRDGLEPEFFGDVGLGCGVEGGLIMDAVDVVPDCLVLFCVEGGLRVSRTSRTMPRE